MIGFETGWLFAHNSFPFTGGYFVPADKKSLADVYLMRRLFVVAGIGTHQKAAR